MAPSPQPPVETPREARLRRQDFVRSEGGMVCPHCGNYYRDHPFDPDDRTYNDIPVLHVLCDGTRVKL
jgi:hypothetical protein